MEILQQLAGSKFLTDKKRLEKVRGEEEEEKVGEEEGQH